MFRAAMVTVLLTLAIGQNSRLLCRVWCDSHLDSSTACAHERLTQTAIIDATCAALDEIAEFIREDKRRGCTALDSVPVLAAAGFQLPRPAARAYTGFETARALRSAAPLLIALRV
jgi:hypothetical protein